MDEILRIDDQYYIQAGSKVFDDRTKVIKHDQTFALFDRYGDIPSLGSNEQGLYHDGTRFLSLLSLKLEGKRPLFLSSTVTEDNVLFSVDLTNPDIWEGAQLLPRGTLHLCRSKFLWKQTLYERVRVSNYGSAPVDVHLDLQFGSDFVDIFEVRG